MIDYFREVRIQTVMAKIIITADDYGAIDAIDIGIIDAINNGPVNSVAAFANGKNAKERLRKLVRETSSDLEIGCHLTLTSGSPVLPISEVTSLYDEGDKVHFRDFSEFQYSMDLGEVEAELRAQMDVFKEANIKIAHLSSHHGSLDYFQDYHRILLKLAHDFYPGEIIPTRSPAVSPKIRGLIWREFVKVRMEDDNSDEELDWFANFGNRIRNDRKVKRLIKDLKFPNSRIPYCANTVHYGLPDRKLKSQRAIERKAPKRRKKLLRNISKLKTRKRPYEYVIHLMDEEYSRFDEYVRQLETQEYEVGLNDHYFDGRMIEKLSITQVTKEDLKACGATLGKWSEL